MIECDVKLVARRRAVPQMERVDEPVMGALQHGQEAGVGPRQHGGEIVQQDSHKKCDYAIAAAIGEDPVKFAGRDDIVAGRRRLQPCKRTPQSSVKNVI